MSAPSATECHVQLFQLLPLDLPSPAVGTTPLLGRFIPTSAPPMILAVSAHSRGFLPSRCPCHELIPWEAEEQLPKSSARLSLTGIAVTAEPPPAVPTPQPAPCPRAASLQPLGEADVAPRSPGRAISSPREQLLAEARCCWHAEVCWAGLALPRGEQRAPGQHWQCQTLGSVLLRDLTRTRGLRGPALCRVFALQKSIAFPKSFQEKLPCPVPARSCPWFLSTRTGRAAPSARGRDDGK